MENKTQIIAEEGKQELWIVREFDLPIDLLYRAFTEKEFIEQWMGTNVIQLEHKNQGNFRFETSHQGQVVFAAHGCIHEAIPNTRVIRTFEMANASIGAQLEILHFEKKSDQASVLRMQTIYQSEKHRAEQLKLPFSYGINMAHNRLQEIIQQQA